MVFKQLTLGKGIEIREVGSTVKPRFNEVPRNWGNLFVKLRAGSLYGTPFNEFSGKLPKYLLYPSLVNN